jgi:hypothetical protein
MIAILTVALLAAAATAFAQAVSAPAPASMLGTWRVVRYVEVGGHAVKATVDDAPSFVGQTMSIGRDSFTNPSAHRFFVCHTMRGDAQLALRTETVAEYKSVPKGSLVFYGLPEADPQKVRSIVVSRGDREVCEFELTRDGGLALYYDGFVFFLAHDKG